MIDPDSSISATHFDQARPDHRQAYPHGSVRPPPGFPHDVAERTERKKWRSAWSNLMTLPKKRMYDFRIIDWQVFTPEEQERIYMQLLTSESLEVNDAMRKLILEEWPELAHKLAPKRPPE